MNPSSFDLKAATWDDNPGRQKLMMEIAGAIIGTVPLQPHWKMLDYGCGTATLSVLLKDRLGGIVAADASAGMVEQARRKLAGAGIGSIQAVQADLCQETPPGWRQFDIVATAMCLHHIENLALLGHAFAAVLPPGGWLTIADLHVEDGSFHDDPTIPHRGFDPNALGRLLGSCGFEVHGWQTIHQMHRPDRNRDYPIFLLTLRRERS